VESHAIQKISLYAIAVSPLGLRSRLVAAVEPARSEPFYERNSDAVAGLR
jgi:hypothetical protein